MGRPPDAARASPSPYETAPAQAGTGTTRSADMALIEDRGRIARGLTDVLIHRLFAVGLDLQTALAGTGERHVAEKINSAIDDLDQAIKDVRNTIFELGNAPPHSGSLRALIIEVAERACESNGGTRPTITLHRSVHAVADEKTHSRVVGLLHEILTRIPRGHVTNTHINISGDPHAPGRLIMHVEPDGRH